MRTIVDLTETQLDLLVKNKEHFEKMKVGGLVKKNMVKSGESSVKLSAIMQAKAPASMQAESAQLEKRREVALGKAIAAFAGATGGEDQADGEDDSD
jgi:hypothetical protein